LPGWGWGAPPGAELFDRRVCRNPPQGFGISRLSTHIYTTFNPRTGERDVTQTKGLPFGLIMTHCSPRKLIFKPANEADHFKANPHCGFPTEYRTKGGGGGRRQKVAERGPRGAQCADFTWTNGLSVIPVV